MNRAPPARIFSRRSARRPWSCPSNRRWAASPLRTSLRLAAGRLRRHRAPPPIDDLVLPDGFTYDVVIKWGDTFTASGDRFGFNNDFIGVFPLGGDDDALLWINHEYVSLATVSGNVDLYGQTFRMLRGHVPTVRDYKRDVGGSVVRVRRDGATGAWTPVLRDPPEPPRHRLHALPRGRPRGAAHEGGRGRGHVRELRGRRDPLGHRAELRGEHPSARAGGNGYARALSQRRQLRPARRPLRLGRGDRSPRSHLRRPSSTPRSAASGTKASGLRVVAGPAPGRLHGRRPHRRARVEVRQRGPLPAGPAGEPRRSSPRARSTSRASRKTGRASGVPILMDTPLDPAPSPRDPKPRDPAGRAAAGRRVREPRGRP